ncbi:unnamed protein product [Protopolystoma xenopodis]|uniref:Uncharacterized protein n=1 Tax=Protopolystoma xenopodis TaxID=117903 RepID=A0A3S5BLE3_9PLAT|nr:unnamed protein product [Protopolystoma xenopodis]
MVIFGLSNTSHVAYSLEARIAFSHLFFKDWDPSHETLPYPPAIGSYALYTKSDFFDHIAHLLTQVAKLV